MSNPTTQAPPLRTERDPDPVHVAARDVPVDGLVLGLARDLKPRLPHLAEADLEHQVRAALREMAPIRVTAYLGVLVERRLRGQFPRQRA